VDWHFRFLSSCSALCAALALSGCARLPEKQAAIEYGESVVLAGEQAASLAFKPLPDRPVMVRSTYLHSAPNVIVYQPGKDYQVNSAGGLRRTPGSRIPDFSTNILFGVEDFRHDQFPGYGNGRFFAYVDYSHTEALKYLPPMPPMGVQFLPQTQQKLRTGKRLRIVAFGDSITAGGEASSPDLVFWQRWAQVLRWKYAQAKIETINSATGGDTTVHGLMRLQEKVLALSPDLVLIGFGMNDQNIQPYGVPPPAFAENLREIIDRIRGSTRAEIVLLSTFPPNPKWQYGSHSMPAYAAATAQVARDKQCAFADVYGLWIAYTNRKKPEDVLANNINHPNDYGHWIFFQALQRLDL
jgi:acyl-CoA thioesterase I